MAIMPKNPPSSSSLVAATAHETATRTAPISQRTSSIDGTGRQPLRIMLIQSPASSSQGSFQPGQKIM